MMPTTNSYTLEQLHDKPRRVRCTEVTIIQGKYRLCSWHNEWTDGAVQWVQPWGWTHKRRKKWWWRTLVCYTQKGPSTRGLKLSVRTRNCRAATQFRIQRHRLSFLLTIFILVLFLFIHLLPLRPMFFTVTFLSFHLFYPWLCSMHSTTHSYWFTI